MALCCCKLSSVYIALLWTPLCYLKGLEQHKRILKSPSSRQQRISLVQVEQRTIIKQLTSSIIGSEWLGASRHTMPGSAMALRASQGSCSNLDRRSATARASPTPGGWHKGVLKPHYPTLHLREKFYAALLTGSTDTNFLERPTA